MLFSHVSVLHSTFPGCPDRPERGSFSIWSNYCFVRKVLQDFLSETDVASVVSVTSFLRGADLLGDYEVFAGPQPLPIGDYLYAKLTRCAGLVQSVYAITRIRRSCTDSEAGCASP